MKSIKKISENENEWIVYPSTVVEYPENSILQLMQRTAERCNAFEAVDTDYLYLSNIASILSKIHKPVVGYAFTGNIDIAALWENRKTRLTSCPSSNSVYSNAMVGVYKGTKYDLTDFQLVIKTFLVKKEIVEARLGSNIFSDLSHIYIGWPNMYSHPKGDFIIGYVDFFGPNRRDGKKTSYKGRILRKLETSIKSAILKTKDAYWNFDLEDTIIDREKDKGEVLMEAHFFRKGVEKVGTNYSTQRIKLTRFKTGHLRPEIYFNGRWSQKLKISEWFALYQKMCENNFIKEYVKQPSDEVLKDIKVQQVIEKL